MSAALQTAPHQPTSVAVLTTSPLVPASPSSRRYPSSHSSPTRENHANSHASGPSPASSSPRRPSRRPSASDSQPGPSSSMSSRAAVASPVPVLMSAAPSEYQPPTSERRRNNMPAAVPPRGSSAQHSSGTSSHSRRVHGSERATNSPRRAPADSSRSTANYSAENGPSDEAPAQSSRSRRANQIAQEPPERTSSNRESRATGSTTLVPIRSQQAPPTQNSTKGPTRETSEILNSVTISPPEDDIEREKERLALAQPHHVEENDAATPPIVGTGEHEEGRRQGRSRHDHSKREKHIKFGEYILGNTIGEGEFGKVKLGWKQEGGVQVAIKLIKKDQLGSNPSRMAKIMREVAILKQLTHPNIVRLHKMEESERHFGIVLEYASGGELFDYILNHRYLKDNAARRLFAQLVSGVGYLHKKGIVHRDLKLENLLLDRNRNIIITDFGFANTFDPEEELTEEEELNLTDRDFVKRAGLDQIKDNGHRKGDLMQTSCGSPCYAAPELVVSDALYTGRKVDVWSCGVILYAMLAGYLPFDDDPANPEGDNINLLYKYIVNTPLTFPEYVTPHARDLLRRILVPSPRKRADLFEVARHSWLSEFAHVVEFITSSTTTSGEIQNTTVPAEDAEEGPSLGRSASVREGTKKATASPTIGGLATKQGIVDSEAEAVQAKQQRDAKRRTVQVEYVAPNTTTQRGESSGSQGGGGKTRARSGSQGPVEVPQATTSPPKDKPLPRDPPVSKESYGKAAGSSSTRPPSSHRTPQGSSRPARDSRSTSDNAGYSTMPPGTSGPRPVTGGSTQSSRSRVVGTRASYGQPAPPELADTNVHGRIQQPAKGGAKNYPVPSPVPQEQQNMDYGRPSVSLPPKFAQVSGFAEGEGNAADVKGHKRSSTVSEISGRIFGRSGSLFGGKSKKKGDQPSGEKTKKYPPVSMKNPMPAGDDSRQSIDSRRSRRSFSVGLSKKRSGSVAASQHSQEKQSRRFSFIPMSFSLKGGSSGGGRDFSTPPPADSQQDLPIQEPPHAVDQYGRYVDQGTGREPVDATTLDGMYAQLQEAQHTHVDPYHGHQQQYAANDYGVRQGPIDTYRPGAMLNNGSESLVDNSRRPPGSAPQQQAYQQGGGFDARRVTSAAGNSANRGVLQKNKRLNDAWNGDEFTRPDHSGSSGPARRVMDFFRRRGKARVAENN